MADNTILRQAEELMNESWRRQGKPYAFELDIEDWPRITQMVMNDMLRAGNADPHLAYNREQAMRLGVELMAGRGPDLVYARDLDIRTMSQRGFLADINALIENHPASSRCDFHEHILDALMMDGGLYVFPVSFGFYRVGVNAAIPQTFIDRFMGYSSITFAGMLEFYIDFMEAFGDEFGHMRPAFAYPTYRDFPSAVIAGMSQFIDFDAGRASLNSPEFVEILNSLARVARTNVHFGDDYMDTMMPGRRVMEEWIASSALFYINSNHLQGTEAFFSRQEPFFVNFIPLVDDYGSLAFDIEGRDTWALWSIPAAGNPALAWELVTYLLEAYYYPVGSARFEPIWGATPPWTDSSISSPIKRSHFDGSIQRAFDSIHGPYVPPSHTGWANDPGTPEWKAEAQNAISILASQNEMPVAHINPLFPPLVRGFILEPLEHLRLDVITAEAAAQQIHNSVQLWLLE